MVVNNYNNKTSLIIIILSLLFFSVLSWSGDFRIGLTALQNGDFATAQREWTLLAEQGNERTQYHLGVMDENAEEGSRDYKTAGNR